MGVMFSTQLAVNQSLKESESNNSSFKKLISVWTCNCKNTAHFFLALLKDPDPDGVRHFCCITLERVKVQKV